MDNYNDIQLPKVLIFGHQFDNKTGLGITLSNLFAEWPLEQIGVMAQGLNIDECARAKSCSLYIGSPIKALNVKTQNNRFRNYVKLIYTKAGIVDIRHKCVYTQNDIKKAQCFDPDILFCCLGSYSSMLDCVKMMTYLPRTKLVLYIVDDWINSKVNDRYLKLYWKKANDKLFRRLLAKSSGLLSICQDMSNAYYVQYKKTFYPFHNPVSIDLWNRINLKPKYAADKCSIIYTGKINDDTKDCLLDVCKVVTKLNNQGYKYVFDVYSPNAQMNDKLFIDYPDCHIMPAVKHDDVPYVIKSYSALLLTLGFSNKSKKYVRLSMPTKLSECLASGIPTLLYCPEEIALARFLVDKECVIPCLNRNEMELSNSLKKLEDSLLCELLVKKAISVASNFDISVVRQRFEKQMKEFNQ